MAVGKAQPLRIELVWSPEPGGVESLQLDLAVGSTVADALRALPAGWAGAPVGVWGHKVELTDSLTDGDRVEVYRPLTVDPMDARRRRHDVQGGGRPIISRHRPQAKR